MVCLGFEPGATGWKAANESTELRQHPVAKLLGTINKVEPFKGGAGAVAQSIYLCSPSCSPGWFEYQPQHLCLFNFDGQILYLLLDYEKNENKQKQAVIGPLKNYIETQGFLISVLFSTTLQLNWGILGYS